MRIDKEIAAATYDSVVKTYNVDLTLPEDGLRLLIDEGRSLKLDRDVSFDQVADFSLLREAQRELGIREK